MMSDSGGISGSGEQSATSGRRRLQPRRELALGESRAGDDLDGELGDEAPDLDATITRPLQAEMATYASP